jgi:hypothetical protein
VSFLLIWTRARRKKRTRGRSTMGKIERMAGT